MFKTRKRKDAGEVNTSSTADIAFLLLIFFLVTTTINSEKGIGMILPPKAPPEDLIIHEKNVLNVLINSTNQIMVDGELSETSGIKDFAKKFIDNNGMNPELSENPQNAIVSIKADRGTSYEVYIEVLDAVKAAYNELRASHVGLQPAEFLQLDMKKPSDREKFEQAKEAYPIMISEADPSDVQ